MVLFPLNHSSLPVQLKEILLILLYFNIWISHLELLIFFLEENIMTFYESDLGCQSNVCLIIYSVMSIQIWFLAPLIMNLELFTTLFTKFKMTFSIQKFSALH